MEQEKLLEVKNLSKFFISSNGVKKAVDDISFNVNKGEVLGLVGQSGSGKTTTGNAIMRLLKEVNGIIAFEDKVVSGKLNKKEKKEFVKGVQMVFQNPYTALNPKRNIFSTLQEPLLVNKILKNETKEFLKSWINVIKYWKYTFLLNFYEIKNKDLQLQIDLTQKQVENIKRIAKKEDFKDKVFEFYSSIKEYQLSLNKILDTSIKSYKKLYKTHKEKLDKNKLTQEEKSMIKIDNEILSLKDQKIIAFNYENRVLKLRQEELKELKNISLNSHKLLKSLEKDRKKRKIFLKRTKYLSYSNEETINIIKSIHHAKQEHNIVKKINKTLMCAHFDAINDIDELIYVQNNFNDDFEKLIFEKMMLAHNNETNKISNKYNEKISNLTNEWKDALKKYKFDFPNKSALNSKLLYCNNKIELYKLKQTYKFKRTFSNVIENSGNLKSDFLNSKTLLRKQVDENFNKFFHEKNKVILENKNLDENKLFTKELSNAQNLKTKEKVNYLKWKNTELVDIKVKLNDSKIKHQELLKDLQTAKIRFNKEKNNSLTSIKKEINNLNKNSDLKIELDKYIIQEKKQIESILVENKIVGKSIKMQKIILGIKKSSHFQRTIALKKSLSRDKIYGILQEVGLKSEHAYRYPHEFSGGQLQRIVIARSIIINPKLIIADEPVASLDVSIQAQIINILNELVRKRNISMIFIAHDISVIEYISDSIIIMHNGKIVEKGLSEKIINNPIHPYSKTLFKSVPSLKNVKEPFERIDVDNSYILEYHKDEPSMQKFVKDHYVLANEAQKLKWGKNQNVKSK